MGLFYNVNRIGTSKVVTSIPIWLGHYRQLQIRGVPIKREKILKQLQLVGKQNVDLIEKNAIFEN